MMECIFAYKNVILIPGILSARKNMDGLKDMIQTAHKGTNVTIIDLYPEVESFVPLNYQLSNWRERIGHIMEESPEGVHLVCHSQGIYTHTFNNGEGGGGRRIPLMGGGGGGGDLNI